MLHLLDESLEAFLRAVVPLPAREVDIAFAAPDGEWSAALSSRPTVDLYLWDIRPNLSDRDFGEMIVEEPDGRRAGPLERHALAAEVGDHQSARLGEGLAERLHPRELHEVALGPPVRVVEVLPPARVVGADRLQVTVVVRRDPDVLPGRWDHQVLDPLDVLTAELLPLSVEVDEALARPATGPARLVGGGTAQARHGQ